MTSSNRLANRLVLLFIGLAALAAAALVSVPALTGGGVPLDLPDDADRGALGILLAASVAVVVFAAAWICTRGRGRRRLAYDGADVRIDAGVVESLILDALSSSPDVAGARVTAFDVRGQRTLLLTVQTRRHPDLVALTGRLHDAIAAADERLGAALPLVVHLTTGLRTTLARSRVTR